MDIDSIHPKDFFELLYEDEDFCTQLGKLVLAASVLESGLRTYLRSREVPTIKDKATFL